MTLTEKQAELLKHLEARKIETEAWVAEDPQNRFAGYLTTDISHWAEIGVNSVEDLERYELISFISDESKSVYGSRLRLDFDSMSMEELRAQADRIAEAARYEVEREAEIEEENLLAYEEEIAKAISLGAKDRETAIRWLSDV